MRIPFLGGIGVLELVIILVVVLLIFGPKNLPKLGNAIGRTVKSMRDGMDGNKKKSDVEDKPEDAEADAQEEPVEAEPEDAQTEERAGQEKADKAE